MALKIESDKPIKVERVFAKGGKVVRETSIVGTKEQIKKIKDRKKPMSKSTKKTVKIKKQPKFLRKPTAKGPTPISARKTLKSFAHSTGPIVKEVERKEVVQDNRSQFFKDEFTREEIGVNKWLS